MKGNVFLIAAALLSAALVAGPAANHAAGANSPVVLTFDKVLVAPGVWEGTVTGDIDGTLTTILLNASEAGPILRVEFDFVVMADDPTLSLTIRQSGILNTRTGGVVMDGVVTVGAFLGAQVHEAAQLVDPSTLRFQGTIWIFPAS